LYSPIMTSSSNIAADAIYRFIEGKLKRLTDYMGIPVAELSNQIKEMEGKIVFLGDACNIHKDYFIRELGDRVRIAPPNTALARASSVAVLAGKAYLEGKLESCYDMVPFYLRKSQAERERENADKKVKADD
ncbi:MAG TPA: tRNA (adenosine(37)-N6)-threonylcarbamoyltransferase complex dimerization subunit type 1 TsaB, partial [Ruminiclostridium sp.]|nr:tRNA (adenosine(37)-N6)-threonylcarbamoyltransferase complex dimerization subunit type 1 TsaB [Ruminiclostridium sp.]